MTEAYRRCYLETRGGVETRRGKPFHRAAVAARRADRFVAAELFPPRSKEIPNPQNTEGKKRLCIFDGWESVGTHQACEMQSAPSQGRALPLLQRHPGELTVQL